LFGLTNPSAGAYFDLTLKPRTTLTGFLVWLERYPYE